MFIIYVDDGAKLSADVVVVVDVVVYGDGSIVKSILFCIYVVPLYVFPPA